VLIDGQFSATCVRYYSIPNGVKVFTNDPIICESGHLEFIRGNYFCMPGPISISSHSTGHSSLVMCIYKVFNDTNNLTRFFEASDPALCGYN